MTHPKKKPAAPKAVKGWAIVDPDGFLHTVCACDSVKFAWRKFMMLPAYSEQEMLFYKQNGYRHCRVLITPL